YLEPLRAPRVSGAAERARAIQREEGRARLEDSAGVSHPDASRRRLRLPVPRRPVRPGRQPDRRPARPSAQPLQLLDRQRPPRPRHAVQRVARRRDGEGREDPRLQARRPRHARGRLGAGLLPGAAAALMAVAPTRTKKSERRQRMEAAVNYPLDWLEERSGIVGGLRYFLFRKVPGDTNWFHTLGSATLTAFLVQAVTGVILAMYYKPDPNSAYQ